MTIMAFDFGLKRVGVAVGDRTLKIPHPLETIDAAENAKRFAAIASLIKEWQPVLLVVGQPKHIDGGEHAMEHLVRKFGKRLEREFGIKTEFVDEYLSSHAAAATLQECGIHGAKKKRLLDSVAAQEILRTYFAQVSYATT